MRMRFQLITLLTGVMLSATAAAQPFHIKDDFSTGDLSFHKHGFSWDGTRTANDPSSPTHIAPSVRNGKSGHGLHIHYRADRKSTRLNSSHVAISYSVFCLNNKI